MNTLCSLKTEQNILWSVKDMMRSTMGIVTFQHSSKIIISERHRQEQPCRDSGTVRHPECAQPVREIYEQRPDQFRH